MTDAYIDEHFDEIKAHACDIEARLDDSYCTPERLKRENRWYREGCAAAGEAVTLIEEDYERTIASIRF